MTVKELVWLLQAMPQDAEVQYGPNALLGKQGVPTVVVTKVPRVHRTVMAPSAKYRGGEVVEDVSFEESVVVQL